MIQEITLTKRVQTPTPPNEWCYQDQGENYRYFTKRVLLGHDAEPWHECETRYKEGYDLLWSLRQDPHTEEERATLEAQYAAWQTVNPDLADEIDASVPVKPETEPLEPEEAAES